jgi:hypothetical protein
VVAFVARCERALARLTGGRAAPIELAYGFQALADAPSPEEALAAAEQAARSAEAREAGVAEISGEAA